MFVWNVGDRWLVLGAETLGFLRAHQQLVPSISCPVSARTLPAGSLTLLELLTCGLRSGSVDSPIRLSKAAFGL